MTNKIPIIDKDSDVYPTFQTESFYVYTSHFDIIDLSHVSRVKPEPFSCRLQTFNCTSQSPVHESNDGLLQHSLFENTRGPARNDFMLGQIAKMAPVFENRKENKQVSSGRNDIWEDGKHELCQLLPLKSL